MPIIASGFHSPFFLCNGHLQTIAAALLPPGSAEGISTERVELADGDFLDLTWRRADSSRLAIICHGLEGNAEQNYVRRMSAALTAGGWDVLAWSFRGCSPGEPNRLLRFYHSGETDDLRQLIERTQAPYSQIDLVGFSLGANVVLKYLGERPPHDKVVGAVAISAPVELAASTRALDSHWSNQFYVRRFLKTLTAKVEAKALRFPEQFDLTGIHRMRSFLEFDDRFTARIHGYKGADDYWRQSSSRQFLASIDVPTLMLSAHDDPFLPPECFPYEEAGTNPALFLEAPAHGGHTGFIDWSTLRGGSTWSERRAFEFLSSPR